MKYAGELPAWASAKPIEADERAVGSGARETGPFEADSSVKVLPSLSAEYYTRAGLRASAMEGASWIAR